MQRHLLLTEGPPVPLHGKDKPAAGTVATEEVSEESQKKTPCKLRSKLLCRFCQHAITTTSEQTAVSGSHIHVKANPAGVVFELGCFASATGARTEGAPEQFWSWFAGYSWQLVICSSCRNHLGWRFCARSNSFFGLILDRLIESSTREY